MPKFCLRLTRWVCRVLLAPVLCFLRYHFPAITPVPLLTHDSAARKDTYFWLTRIHKFFFFGCRLPLRDSAKQKAIRNNYDNVCALMRARPTYGLLSGRPGVHFRSVRSTGWTRTSGGGDSVPRGGGRVLDLWCTIVWIVCYPTNVCDHTLKRVLIR